MSLFWPVSAVCGAGTGVCCCCVGIGLCPGLLWFGESKFGWLSGVADGRKATLANAWGGKGLSRLLLGVNAVHDHYSSATQLSVWLLARVRLTV